MISDESEVIAVRSARPKALRFTAASMHPGSGCTHAPLPGSEAVASANCSPVARDDPQK